MVCEYNFFNSLYEACEGTIETRLIDNTKGIKGAICDHWPIHTILNPETHQEFMEPFLKKWKAVRDIYFGIGTRDGIGGTLDHVIEIPAVWCDVDIKDDSNEVIDRLKRFPLKASAVIHSGGGFHLYWFLKEPATKNEFPYLVDVNKRIAAANSGDMAATDAARILRIPETWNHKRQKPVRLIRLDDFRYNLEDFEILPEAPTAARSSTVDVIENVRAIAACAFLRWCFFHQADVSEPLWYAMVSNIGRVYPGGIELVHAFSREHPNYSPKETDRKILQALNQSGPHTCAYIRAQGFRGCGECSHTGSPISRVQKAKGKNGNGNRSGRNQTNP